ncbi:MAG: hypothetical protein RML40_03365 [Bacteroidota bacterium]|nr:hypothetical protein [Candidatus Kapabacteria bacterium]MDW8219550.1 hypothetical protein [Bacteroidota bacterium]
MGNFDPRVLAYACFLAFIYALLALGATAYRQILDDVAAKDVKLGEDLDASYDPLMMVILGGIVLLAVLFTWIALAWSEARIELYVVPLCLAINFVQFYYRMHQQRLQIKTLGLVGRTIFEEGWRLVRYDQIYRVEVEHDPLWDTVIMYYADNSAHTFPTNDAGEFCRRLTHTACKALIAALQARTNAEIVVRSVSGKHRREGT